MATEIGSRQTVEQTSAPAIVAAAARVEHAPVRGDRSRAGRRRGRFLASAMICAAVLPGLAATCSVALYVAQGQWVGWLNDGGPRAYLVGSAGGMVLWLLMSVAARGIATPNGGNPSAHGQLREALDDLTATFASLAGCAGDDSARTSLAVAERHLDYLRRSLDGELLAERSWVEGTAYVDLWRRVHRVEEALLMVRPRDALIGSAVHDTLRLMGSTIPKRERLMSEIVDAMTAIDPEATATFLQNEQTRSLNRVAAKPTEPSELGIRAVLGAARHSINQFRDHRRAGLVRSRNHLLATVGATGFVTYIFLGIAFIMQASVEAIVAFSAFFLTGSVVGLFRQLQAASTGDGDAEDDFGLSYARLLHAPLFSGLAAVAGVMLTALASQLMLANGTAGAKAGVTIPSLDQVFNLTTNQGGLVFAAMFGLVPNLFIARLQLRADSYKADLRSSESAEQIGRMQS